MKFQKKLIFVSLAVILAFSAVSCGGSGAGTDGAGGTKGSTLVYGSGDYTAINPALYEHGEINSLIFNGLTAHDAQDRIVPCLAESWEFDEASNTYTFHLRKDVKWQDGVPFTSKDVRFTIEAIMDPNNGSEIASNYEDIMKIDIVDDLTIKIKLSAPNVALLEYLTVGILPEHLLAGKDLATDVFNQKPVGTGPYKLTGWDQGQSITLTKNEEYFAGAPSIDQIIFKIVVDTKARAMQLKSGELDMAQITPRDMEEFKGSESFDTYVMKTADYRGILYNFNHPLFQMNRELPNALSYSIDRKAIIDSVLLGHGQAAYSPLQAGPYNNQDIERYDYNPEKAKQLLAEAGWKPGTDGILEKDGMPLAFAINCGEGDQVRIDMANICRQQLEAIGADVTVKVNAETDWAGQEAYLIGWGSPFDPDDHTYKVFGTEKGSNFSAYSNRKVDQLLQKARETDVDSERMKYYQEFQTELSKDLPYTFIAYVDAIYVCRKDIQGISADTVLGHHGVGVFWNIADWTIGEKK